MDHCDYGSVRPQNHILRICHNIKHEPNLFQLNAMLRKLSKVKIEATNESHTEYTVHGIHTYDEKTSAIGPVFFLEWYH